MYCYLCNIYSGFNSTFCQKCQRLKRIISLYDINNILESLEFIYLRDADPIKNRTAKLNTDLIKELKTKAINNN